MIKPNMHLCDFVMLEKVNARVTHSGTYMITASDVKVAVVPSLSRGR